ncbi:lysine-rich arabinogalactan protein 19-like [Penaeus japonicus]|uniref:lysine-rich arabinogalactan protein 19-like n=1 Tax=Penaeus japonicus TaxID=27405 RepID=UPI001C71603B|nr:lysine-rich arabinogalactan protein 19-like [Penaeus japonicus]
METKIDLLIGMFSKTIMGQGVMCHHQRELAEDASLTPQPIPPQLIPSDPPSPKLSPLHYSTSTPSKANTPTTTPSTPVPMTSNPPLSLPSPHSPPAASQQPPTVLSHPRAPLPAHPARSPPPSQQHRPRLRYLSARP